MFLIVSGDFVNLTCAYFVKWVGEKPPTHVAFEPL